MFEFNKEIKQRDEIIFGYYDPEEYFGGVREFKKMTLQTLKTLIKERFMEEDEQINNRPSNKEFVSFMEKHSDRNFTVNGYAVQDTRGDYRVSIEAISYEGSELDDNTIIELVEFTHNADDVCIEKDYVHCWWD